MKPTIGLEIHVELKTLTKMFCDSLNDPAERHPNINICPICVGHPGTLPTINKKAVEQVLKIGLAVGGQPATHSRFNRKNYFYPDLPKGYQISQFEEPLISGGQLSGVRIRRIHLEEDAGRLTHDKNNSLVDFNRAGLPLLELVTEPDITSAGQAAAFAQELQLILRYLDISDADMEKGHLRIEVNVSLNLGTKVEVKNINSFRAAAEAINYELKRQEKLLQSGKKIIQETRGWDDVKKETISQRTKEEAHDYRYFPEPDLPPFDLSAFDLPRLRQELPELPAAKRKRFAQEYHLNPEQTEILIQDRGLARFFEEAVSEQLEIDGVDQKMAVQLLYNYLTTDLKGLLIKEETRIEDLKITPADFAELIRLLLRKEISSRIAKNILAKMFASGGDPEELIKAENLSQVSSEELLKQAALKVLQENPVAIADFKNGKDNALQFLIGKTMSELGGRANPQLLHQLFKELLK